MRVAILVIVLLIAVSNCYSQEISLLGIELVSDYVEIANHIVKEPETVQISESEFKTIEKRNPKIHSWIAMDVENGLYKGSSRNNVKPRSVASTIKLAVVNCILKAVKDGSVSLKETLTVKGPNDQTSDGEKPGAKYTVEKAIYHTLYRSSNTCPNLLAIRLGGLGKLNGKLSSMGYKKTRYNYLSSVNRTEFEKNPGSTAYDMALVAKDFFNKYRFVQGTGSGTAWYAFTHAKDLIKAEGFNTLGGKIGSNSLSATNTGLVEINDRVYAIVVFSEENGLVNNYEADKYLTWCTTHIARAINGSLTTIASLNSD
jgi:D-alanyl-D-alanine carboxypeptidase